jgi:serine protease Do
MSNLSSNNHPLHNRMLASAAALALVASGGAAIFALAPAQAAAVITSDLQSPPTPSFATLIQRVKPAVVSVKVKFAETAANSQALSDQMQNMPPQMREFFEWFRDKNGGTPHFNGLQGAAVGSGFFISSEGYVVTNNHVVKNATSVSVTLGDGRILDAKVVGTDPKTDLALLKVAEKGDYPYVSFAKDTPRIGDWVVAIGSPFGLGDTVTAGIVSGEGRDIGEGPYDDFLQIDAPINKGNSGGPDFNMKGEVVGVNTAIFSPSGGSIGLGFAIPASTAASVIESLEHGGVVIRGFLGVHIQSLSKDLAEALGLEAASGALVDQTDSDTPAATAGLKSGDLITKLNGQTIQDAGDLTRRVGALKPGDKVELSYLRDGNENTASITLGEQKTQTMAKANTDQNRGAAVMGVELAPASQVSGAGHEGVAIVNVDPSGAAASKGLSDGDVILDVSGKAVSSPEDVKAGIATAKKEGKKAILVRVRTADGSRYVAFALPKA